MPLRSLRGLAGVSIAVCKPDSWERVGAMSRTLALALLGGGMALALAMLAFGLLCFVLVDQLVRRS